MSDIIEHNSASPIRQSYRMSRRFSSQEDFGERLTRAAGNCGLQVAIEDSKQVSFDVQGHRALTTFHLVQSDPQILRAETLVAASPSPGSGRKNLGPVLLCLAVGLMFPAWTVGFAMVAAVVYVGAPLVLRDRFALAKVDRIVAAMES